MLKAFLLTTLFVLAGISSASAQKRMDLELERESQIPIDGNRGGRIAVESVMGLGSLVVPAFVGLGIGAAAENSSSSYCFLCGAGGFVMGGAIGASLMPLAVTWGGEIAGGRGHAGGAYLGFLAGSAIYAASVGLASLGDNDMMLNGFAIAGSVLPLAGAIIGYEMTDHRTRWIERFHPNISASRNGFMLDVSGTF